MIKAIETVYNGYRFRSRLEARWAVYFDALGIEYDYEPEGFVLSDGTPYLPDFWLKSVDMWAEVKPTTFTPEERQRCYLLAKLSNQSVIMLDGPPSWRPYWGYETIIDEHGKKWVIDEDWIVDDSYLDEHRFYVSTGFGPEKTEIARFEACWTPDQDTLDAILAARQARFEHGETPHITRR